MRMSGVLLTVRTSMHRYIVRRDHIAEIRMIAGNGDLELRDKRGKPIMRHELGHLLDSENTPIRTRWHALIVSTHHRDVALLVDRVEDIAHTSSEVIQPLAPLLARRLTRPWVLGTLVRDDEPLLVLNLRQIAQAVLSGQHNHE